MNQAATKQDLTLAKSSWELADGARVHVDEASAEIRDGEGRLLIRYEDGRAEVVAGDGDLTLAAPRGRVVVRSGDDIVLQSGRHLELSAARITAVASTMVQQVERFELSAGRLVEKTRDTFRETSDLLQTRAHRMRTFVSRGFSLVTQRTSMASNEETSIDGKKILLG